jgi:hypothetical protein
VSKEEEIRIRGKEGERRKNETGRKTKKLKTVHGS